MTRSRLFQSVPRRGFFRVPPCGAGKPESLRRSILARSKTVSVRQDSDTLEPVFDEQGPPSDRVSLIPQTEGMPALRKEMYFCRDADFIQSECIDCPIEDAPPGYSWECLSRHSLWRG